MKRVIFLIALINTCFSHSYAQSLERQVIGSSGDYNVASWGSLSSTTGETITNTFTSGSSLVLTQGFQQPLQTDLAVQNILLEYPSIQIYPNPAENKINVVISIGGSSKQYSVALFDMIGQKLNLPSEILIGSRETKSFIFDLQSLATASYFIIVSDENEKMVQSFKFIKTD